MFWLLMTACGDAEEGLVDTVVVSLASCDRPGLEAATAEAAREQVLRHFDVACAAVSSLGAESGRTRGPDDGAVHTWSVRFASGTLELGLEHDGGKLTRMRLAGDAAFDQALSAAMYPKVSVAELSVPSVAAGEPVAWSATIAGYTPSATTQLDVAARAVSVDGRVVASGPSTPITAAKAPLRINGQLNVGEPGTHQLQLSVLDRSSGESAGGQLSFEVR